MSNTKKKEIKPSLILDKHLPADVTIELPATLIAKSHKTKQGGSNQDDKKIKIIKKNDDQTITKKEKNISIIIIILMLLMTSVVMFFTFKEKETRDRLVSDKIHKKGTVSSIKSFIITNDQLESTISDRMNSRKKRAAIKVGDVVSYKEAKKPKPIDGLYRNLKAPLYVDFDGFGGALNSKISSPKLPVLKNSYVRVYLETPLTSQSLNMPITAISYIALSGPVKIPKGSKFIMKATGLSDNRVLLTVSNVIFPNGNEYSVRGVAVGEDNLSGVQGQVNYKLAKKGSKIMASSLLNAASTSMSVTGNSFGSIFAGEMAGQTSHAMDSALDYSTRNNGLDVYIPTNTRFKIVFE
jgi:hypothetical protein